MASAPLPVAVVSPQAVVLHGLVGLLGRHPRRVTVVDYPDHDPEVLVYDVLSLLDPDGVDLAEVVGAGRPKVLAVSRDLRPELAARAIAAGAQGAVSIGAEDEELVDAVEAVARGDGSEMRTVRPGAAAGLTERETQVLTLIAQGHTNAEIARALYLSPNSIKTYVRTGYRKIGAASRSQAVSWAIRNGFPTDREPSPDH
jgi:DNA-binding NarL/FixJ family response regulator